MERWGVQSPGIDAMMMYVHVKRRTESTGCAGGCWGGGSARSTWELEGRGGDTQAGPGGTVSRVTQTRRRLACPGPVLGGEILFPRGRGHARCSGRRTRLSGVRGNGPVCPGLGRLLDESHKANQIVDHVHLLHDGKMGKPVFIEKDLTWAPASLHP